MKLEPKRCDPVIFAAHGHPAMKPMPIFVMCVMTAAASGCATHDVPADEAGTHAATEPVTAVHRVLFDAGHRQVAGNAFWIVDGDAPSPVPASPTSASSWSGAISAWGFGLFSSSRYMITQLPSGSTLNFGAGGAGDLTAVDVFISDEPEQAFTATERSALMSFASAGGGIFLVSATTARDRQSFDRLTSDDQRWYSAAMSPGSY